jgi:hypothetical protein
VLLVSFAPHRPRLQGVFFAEVNDGAPINGIDNAWEFLEHESLD